jgi:subtilisin-like proprotein convertase family protein
MWKYNSDYNKWYPSTDSLLKSDYDWLKQELSATRFYSKALSGSSYVAVSNLDNLFETIGEWEPRNWFISSLGSKYSYTSQPGSYPTPIDRNSSYNFYTRSLKEYGLTVKNLFTPERLMKDVLSNYIQVDVATTRELDLTLVSNNYQIDGVRLKTGHKVLVKDQTSVVTLDNSVDPENYFSGPYTLSESLGLTNDYVYYNENNGLYVFENDRLVKLDDLDDYEKCFRLSIYVKMGNVNKDKQFHMRRLLNGFYPTSYLNEPMEFVEKHNWLLRNRVDYNNLFETNYYDILKHGTQSYSENGITYSIPERTVAVGEFGIILNTQQGHSNIIPCKYKSNLRSIDETEKYYWICGDNTLLIRVAKHDFSIKLIKLNNFSSLKSISFYNNLRGVVVGDFNTIYVTIDGGGTWKRIEIPNFSSFTFNKVIFTKDTKFYLGGRGGVFVEFEEDINGWIAHRRRISKQIDDDDEYLLIDHINDLWRTSINNWGLSYSYYTQSIPTAKDIVLIGTDDGKLIAYDENNFVDPEFIYLDFNKSYGNIRNISQQKGTDDFYFSGDDGIYKFDIRDFKYLGVGNTYSNTVISATAPSLISTLYANRLYDYKGEEMLICGNYALVNSATYSSIMNFGVLDTEFIKKLKSKLLFMDYDIGSKLNFFTDEGDYRLPNSTYIDQTFFSSDTKLTFNNLVYGATAPSFMTQSELTWYDYWLDREKTFEYYSSNPLSNTSKVLISKTFSGTSQQLIATVSNVNTNLSDILKLSPSFGFGSSASRYSNDPGNLGTPPIISSAGVSKYTLFLKDYLVVLGVTNSTTAKNLKKSFDVNVGDVLRIKSDIVEGNLIVNRIEDFDMGGKYIYMFSDFNQNIIKQLETSTSSITFTNLNKFSSGNDLIDNFNNHPLGIGYEMSNYNNSVKIDPKFNNFTSYYNLATEIKASSNSDYLEFSSLDLLNYGIPDGTSSVSQTLTCNSNIYTTEIRVKLTIYHERLKNLIINLISPNGKILNILNGPAITLSGLTFSNTIFSTNTTNPSITSLTSPYNGVAKMNLGLNVGSYSYVSNTTNFNDLLNNGNAKGDWKLVVEDTESSYIGYLKNWTILFKGNIVEDLKYTDGFLKFGYTPRYNLLDYMTSINRTNYLNPTFYATKEYLSLPIYNDIPLGVLTASNIYIDSGGMTSSSGNSYNGNKIYFGENLKLEWESIFKDTFVDIDIQQPSHGTQSTSRLLVIDKYFDSFKNGYVIEFHKSVNFVIGSSLDAGTINIRSRRKLSEISDDLQDLNNIHRRKSKTIESYSGNTYDNYESDLNFKISTDSYTKVLLSDVDTVKNITGVLYTDYKNELSLNLTRMDKEYKIPISNTVDINGKLYIHCYEKHDLSNGDGVVLEFNGGTFSSEYLNQKYFGYHTVTQVYNEYDFLTDIDYGNPVYVGNDSGYVKYTRKDPFFNYEPVDLIDVSLNKRAKQSIQLDTDNLKLEGSTYSLVNVDFSRYRFRLVDNLTFDDLNAKFPWILEAEISEAIIGQDSNNDLIWYKGIWEFGRWFGGTWYSGEWRYGDWYSGIWNSKNIKDKKLSIEVDSNTEDNTKSVWYTGRWYDGVWNDGTWLNGRFYDGTWEKGIWNNGIWNDGTWNNGRFIGGIWVTGDWNGGVFNTDNEPAYWIDGTWYGGDFENGIWYNGLFEQKYSTARFGTNAYNSRTATWNGGIFTGGSFYSKLDTTVDVSTTHKYSIWKTGTWNGGDFYGGIAYNMDFKSGTWYGGILDEIQIIGINENNNSFILNGIFRFNIGNDIYVTDKFDNSGLNTFGSTSDPKRYTILKCDVDTVNKLTEIYIDYNISLVNFAGLLKSEVKEGTLLNSVYGNSNISTGYSGSIVDYIYTDEIENKLSNVRVKINLETNPGLTQSLSHLLINLKAPNGKIINVKGLGTGYNDIYLNNTIFSGTQSTDFILGSPLYEGVFKFAGDTVLDNNATINTINYSNNKIINSITVNGDVTNYLSGGEIFTFTYNTAPYFQTVNPKSWTGKVSTSTYNSITNKTTIVPNFISTSPGFSPIIGPVAGLQANNMNNQIVSTQFGATTNKVTDLFLNTTKGYWEIYIKTFDGLDVKINDLKLEFCYSDKVGAQLNKPIENGFDTGLRIVSNFTNANWKTGIWTNGIFESGLYETGIWYDGIFKGTWG